MKMKNLLKEDAFRYLHIVPLDGAGGFVTELVQFFLDSGGITDIEQHLFVTSESYFYEKCRNDCRMILVEKPDDLIQCINVYGKTAKIIFLHGMSWSVWKTYKIRPKLLNKIIWRTWGHDIRLPVPLSEGLGHYVRRWIYYLCLRFIARRFRCVGCANVVDEIKVHRAFGKNVETCIFPYVGGWKTRKNTNSFLREELKTNISNPFLRIMIGHSGYSIDKQIEIMERLKHLSNENVRIFLPLAYGDEDYIAKVVEYAEENFPGRCELLLERVPYEDYARYIHSVDVAVMAAEDSSALGNIDLLVYFEKPIYFDKSSDFAKAFKCCGLPYGNIEDLDAVSIEELGKTFCYDRSARDEYCSSRYDENYGLRKWKYIFDTYG